MKVQQILYSVCVIALALPMMANAEIYKWKGKDGITRYSDTPPPTNVKVDTISKAGTAKSVPSAAKKAVSPEGENESAKPKGFKEPAFEKEANAAKEAASIKAKNAEAEKKNKLAKAEQAKSDASNCLAAKANYQSYAQGGRIYKMDANGERVYMDDAGLASGKKQAQVEISKYCQ